MYIQEKIDAVLDLLQKGIKELTKIKGYCDAEEDAHQYSKKIKKSFDKYEFLQLRFRNRHNEYKEYLKRNNTFEAKIGDLDANKKIESDDDMICSVGSVTERKDGRFMGRFYCLGKRYHVYAKSESACWREMAKKKKELKEFFKNSDVISKTMYLNTWFYYWVDLFKRPAIKESTYLKYLEYYKRYAEEKIGKIRITNFNSSKLQAFINGISAKTPRKFMHQLLNEMFEMLNHENYIRLNPMLKVVLPKDDKDDKPIIQNKKTKILNYADEKDYLAGLKKSKAACYYIVKFILYTGLRRGEAIGLTWQHVDFDNQTIRVVQQWSNSTNKITSPKTKSSYRTIPLLPDALDVLLELKNNDHKPEDFVFQGVKRLTQMLVYYSETLKIDVNAHMLRHTFASRCYAAGLNPKVIQDLLGHKKMDTTLNTYTHVLKKEDYEIINIFRQFFIEKGLIIIHN